MPMQKEIPNAVDLEETQELPALPGAPPQAALEPPAVSASRDERLNSTDAFNAASLRAAAEVDPDRTVLWPKGQPPGSGARIEPRLEPRAAPRVEARQEVRGDETREQRIAALSQREAEIGALRSDLASVRESRGQLENNLGNLTNNLRELEQTLNRKSEQLSMFEREVGVRDRRIAELESRGATLDGELAAIAAERESLRGELKAAREDAESARKLAQAQDASAGAVLKERDQHARRVRQLETDLTQARSSAERYRETLQNMEGRRQIFESMMDEQESELIERGATVVNLQTEIDKRTQFNSTRESELKALLASEQERARQLEQAAIIHRGEEQALRQAAADASFAADKKVQDARRELEARQLIIDELQGKLDKVNSSLNERNSMLERMEAEIAGSSQVLGSIQQNLEHLGDAEPTRMLVRTQGDTGIVQLLAKRSTIGRTPDNDIHLNEDFISRHHAVLLASGVTTVLEDLNSTNGTYVNGGRVNRATLKEGDLVTFGKTEFRFVVKKATDKSAQGAGIA
jgi:pSer/pThr/pTyr-binding forkhead associated (FHA) protein